MEKIKNWAEPEPGSVIDIGKPGVDYSKREGKRYRVYRSNDGLPEKKSESGHYVWIDDNGMEVGEAHLINCVDEPLGEVDEDVLGEIARKHEEGSCGCKKK